ncbi:MAG: hypothetical protein IPK53_17230 [bacterium]|nr:hypothetical protein [bacterium]MBK8130561.1 hypothetical protein [bacterium]
MRLLFVLIFVARCAWAGGSVFGPQPMGDPMVRGGVRAVGLGGAGLAMWDSLGMHTDNAAAMSGITGAVLRAGIFSGLYSVDDGELTDTDSEFGWQAFRLMLNVHRRYKMSIGIDPVSHTDFRTFGQDSLAFNSDSGTVYENFESRKVWLGSATDIRWDHAVTLSKKLSLGATIAFASSYLEANHALDFPTTGSSGGARDVLYHDVQRFRGFWGGLSFLAKPTPRLTVGGFWQSEADGTWNLERAVNHGGRNTFAEPSGKRPGAFGVGVGYAWHRTWAAYLDTRMQQWQSEHYGPMFAPANVDDRNATSVMFGVEKMGGTRNTDEGFDRWDFRAGAAYRLQPWLTRDASGAVGDVNETALSLGVSIPLTQQAGKLHAALELGQRVASDADVTETFTRFYLQLDMHERWFKRERRTLRD